MRLMEDFLKAVLKDSEFWVGMQSARDSKELTGCKCDRCKAAVVKLEGDSGFECDFSVDTRSITKAEIFCAVPGARTDGHNFLAEALRAGAAGVLLERNSLAMLNEVPEHLLHGKLVIIVPSTVAALKKLACSWRKLFSCPVVGITGSLGKTTTKEMLRVILKQANLSAFVSPGNFNTALGVSLSILRMKTSHEIGVFEVGINDKGEMSEIADILRPSLGVITCVAHTHMLGLHNISNAATEKSKLFRNFVHSNVGIVNGDQQELSGICCDHPLVRFGMKTKNQVQARKVSRVQDRDGTYLTKFLLKIYNKKFAVTLNGWHKGFLINALAASAAAIMLKIDPKAIVAGLEGFCGVAGRFETRLACGGKSTIISDCYNASPESVRVALETLGMMSCDQKIVVLGDMLELGEKEVFWHRQIGRALGRVQGISHVVLVGERAQAIAQTTPITMRTVSSKTWETARIYLKKVMRPKSVVLIKSSRAVGLDKLVDALVDGVEIAGV